MQGADGRKLFKTRCQMLGLRREQDDKLKSSRLVNKTKLIFAATVLAIFILVVILTVLSITTQKNKTIPVLQVPPYYDITERSNSENETNNDNSTLETSTEALKYVIVSHPKRSQQADLPPWQRQPPVYTNSYAQLETYRNARKVHSVSDILRFKPQHPSDINKLATSPNYGPRFSNRAVASPFKPIPDYPTHTQAIFHPYSLEKESEEKKSNHKIKGIGADIDRGAEEPNPAIPAKPFSILLDIYPIQLTTLKPDGIRIKENNKVIRGSRPPLPQNHAPPLHMVHLRPPRPPPQPTFTPQPTPQRMLLHLNLYPKKKNKNGRGSPQNFKSNLEFQDIDGSQTTYSGNAAYDQLGNPEEALGLNPQALFEANDGTGYNNATATKRILKWCFNYENDLNQEKRIFFDLILKSFCRNFDSNDYSKYSLQDVNDNQFTAYGSYAKLTMNQSERDGSLEDLKIENEMKEEISNLTSKGSTLAYNDILASLTRNNLTSEGTEKDILSHIVNFNSTKLSTSSLKDTQYNQAPPNASDLINPDSSTLKN